MIQSANFLKEKEQGGHGLYIACLEGWIMKKQGGKDFLDLLQRELFILPKDRSPIKRKRQSPKSESVSTYSPTLQSTDTETSASASDSTRKES
jgi:hypothetical protein